MRRVLSKTTPAGAAALRAAAALVAWILGCAAGLAEDVALNAPLPVPSTNGTVYAVAVGVERVYIGGAFSQVNGLERYNIAAFDPFSGEVDAAWAPRIDGGAVPVHALAVQPGGGVFVGGEFAGVNGQGHPRLAALEPADGQSSGQLLTDWRGNVSDGAVEALAVGAARLYAGGSFTIASGRERNGLAAFSSGDGGLDTRWNPDMRGVGPFSVQALALTGDHLYAGGMFIDTVNTGTTRLNLAAFRPAGGGDGQVDPFWDAHLPGGAQVFALAADGRYLYVGGALNGAGASTSNNLVAIPLEGQGNADAYWRPGVEGLVLGLAVVGGRVYVGGQFDRVNASVTRLNLAACEPAGDERTGQVIEDWDRPVTGAAEDTAVHALVGWQYRLYVGGTFQEVDGLERRNLAGFAAAVALERNGVAPAAWLGYDRPVSRSPGWRK